MVATFVATIFPDFNSYVTVTFWPIFSDSASVPSPRVNVLPSWRVMASLFGSTCLMTPLAVAAKAAPVSQGERRRCDNQSFHVVLLVVGQDWERCALAKERRSSLHMAGEYRAAMASDGSFGSPHSELILPGFIAFIGTATLRSRRCENPRRQRIRCGRLSRCRWQFSKIPLNPPTRVQTH